MVLSVVIYICMYLFKDQVGNISYVGFHIIHNIHAYYYLLLRRETRIPGVAPFSFRIGIWDLFVHRGQKSYTPLVSCGPLQE